MKRRFLGHPKRLALVGLALVALGFWRVASAPARGQVDSAPPVVAPKTVSAAVTASGPYFSFTYPEGYQTADSPISGKILQSHRIYAPGFSDRSLSLALVRESLADDSGISFRQNQPRTYDRQVIAASLIFTKHQGGFERTVYLSHGDLVLAVAAVDSGGQDISVDEQFVLNSLRWR